MITIPLGGGKGLAVDISDQDFPLVGHLPWHPHKGTNTWYAATNMEIDGKRTTILMHRLIKATCLDDAPSLRVDHIDGNGLNNVRSNLRLATAGQNAMNSGKRPGSSSQHKGVYWHPKSGKWMAQIKVNRKAKHLGLFQTEEEAARAWDQAALAAWGEFTQLNFERTTA